MWEEDKCHPKIGTTASSLRLGPHLLQLLGLLNYAGHIAGGSAVAKKLIGLYFTLFKLILQGTVGQAHEMQVKREEVEARKGQKGAQKKKARWKSRPETTAGTSSGKPLKGSSAQKNPIHENQVHMPCLESHWLGQICATDHRLCCNSQRLLMTGNAES